MDSSALNSQTSSSSSYNLSSKRTSYSSSRRHSAFLMYPSLFLVLVAALGALHIAGAQYNTNRRFLIQHDKTMYIPCEMEKAANENFVWFKNNDKINFDVVPDERMKNFANGTLRISKATVADVGDYTCRKMSGTGQLLPIFKMIHLRSKPIIGEFEAGKATGGKSINVVDGDRLAIQCRVIINELDVGPPMWYRRQDGENPNEAGDFGELLQVPMRYRSPRGAAQDLSFDSYMDDMDMDAGAPYASGYTGGEPTPGTERIQIRQELTNGTSSTLIIEPLQFNDRGYYTCVADNGVVKTNRTILIRVKDKLAALWPFLGIVAEVITLCIVIFVYEKRRSKSDLLDESSPANPASQSDSQGKRSGGTSPDVRQRVK